MAEHVVKFCKLKDDQYDPPKDKLQWTLKDNRPWKYKTFDGRWIFRTKEAYDDFIYPDKLPEEEWKQKVVGKPHRKNKKRFFDNLSEFSDFPEAQRPDNDFTIKPINKKSKIAELFSQAGIDLSFKLSKGKVQKKKRRVGRPRKRKAKDLKHIEGVNPQKREKQRQKVDKPRKKRSIVCPNCGGSHYKKTGCKPQQQNSDEQPLLNQNMNEDVQIDQESNVEEEIRLDK